MKLKREFALKLNFLKSRFNVSTVTVCVSECGANHEGGKIEFSE